MSEPGTSAVSAASVASVTSSQSPLTIRLFGPLSVLVNGQPIPHLRSRKAQWLLALLILRHGRPVQREWLAGTLWPDVDQTQAFANLRPALSELRKALGSEGERLQSPNRHCLLLELSGADVDVVTFDRATTNKTPADLERALSLYRGSLLEGCTEEWITQDRDARQQDCLHALQDLAVTATKHGNHEAAAAYWRRAVALDPLWEVARRGLMEALIGSGDSNEALDVYRSFVRHLRRDDPKAAPDAETNALYARLLAAARKRADKALSLQPETSASPAVTGYLPHALTQLIGREDERLEVAALLQRSRLVTLTGPGGIGKTRLAIEVASEVVGDYKDGVWLVALDSLTDGTRVLAQIAGVLQVKETSGKPILKSITEFLQNKRLLLVLDNCEHVRLACATAVAPILRECVGIRVLATSREALRVSGETVWAVPALPVPDPEHLPGGTATLLRVLPAYESVQLFLERARAAGKTFLLTGDNARDVALLCWRLAGVPLALELAAARTPVLSPARIRAQLDACPLDTLLSRQVDVPSRHRTLRATLEWSYGLLPPGAQSFLSDMGVFRDGWTLEAAQAVCPETDALEMLTLLRDASLLDAAPEQDGETRFRALETVREFAAEMLEKSGRGDDVRRRHAAFFADWAEKSTENRQVQEGRAFGLMEREHYNVRAALQYALALAEDTLLVRLCHGATFFWHNTGRNQESHDWMARVAERLNPEGETGSSKEEAQTSPRDSPRERFLRTQQWLCVTAGDFEGAAAASLSVFENYRQRGRAIEGRTNLFNAASYLGTCDLNRSKELMEECLPLERAESADGRGNPVILSRLARIYRRVGQPEKADAFLSESLFIAERDKEIDPHGFAAAHFIAGQDALTRGDWSQAFPHLENSSIFFASQNSPFMNANSLICLASAARMTGDREQAAAYLARAAAAAGPEPAIKLLVTLRREQGEHLLDTGDHAGAARLMRETLTLLRGRADCGRAPMYELALLLAEAEFAPRTAAPNDLRTARLLGAAEGVAVRLGLQAPAHEEQARTARLTLSLTTRLGAERLAQEREQGAALDDEAALELALRLTV